MEPHMKLVNRSITAVMLSIFLFAGLANTPVSAHVLESDNGVSAILHIKPDDRPKANEPTVIRFLLSSSEGGFRINDYDVKLRLFQDDKQVLESDVEPAFFGANAEGDTTITFPEAGVYKLQALGTPVKDETLPFELNYTVRVAGLTEVKTGDGSMPIVIGGFSLVMLGMVAVKGIHSGGRYRQKSKN
jgi:hypothetical protein